MANYRRLARLIAIFKASKGRELREHSAEAARQAGKLKPNDTLVSLDSSTDSDDADESAFDGSQAKGASKAAGEGSLGGSQAAVAGDDAIVARKHVIPLRHS